MKNYFVDLQKEFFSPDESNFKLLTERIGLYYKKIFKKIDLDSPRIKLDKIFTYEEELSKSFIPDQGLNIEELSEKCAEAFEGVIRFHHPDTLFNITPPPAIDTVAISAIVNMYNPNLLWDYVSGKILLYELKVIKYLCDLAGFDYRKAGGFSCFGGKATLMYAVKEGINKTNRDAVKKGLKGDNVVITAKACHYAIESACNYLGLGHEACVRVDCNEKEEIIIDKLEEVIRKNLNDNKKIAAIVLSGGGTLDVNIDPIKRAVELRNKIVKEFNLNYIPHVHVDSVIGWLWLFFKDYDFKGNDLKIEKEVLEKIKIVYNRIAEIKYADSFSADFHKTGFCPYVSSFYISRSADDLSHLDKSGEVENVSYKYGDIQMYQSTIENSRSGAGILSAWLVINKFGMKGFQKYVAYLLSTSVYMRKTIKQQYGDEFETLNDFALGHCIMIKPKLGKNDKSFYKMIHEPDEVKKYYNDYCADLDKYISFEMLNSNLKYPLLGYLSKYRQRTMNTGLAAFRIFPSSLYYNKKKCDEVLKKIIMLKKKFEKERGTKQKDFNNYLTHDHQPS